MIKSVLEFLVMPPLAALLSFVHCRRFRANSPAQEEKEQQQQQQQLDPLESAKRNLALYARDYGPNSRITRDQADYVRALERQYRMGTNHRHDHKSARMADGV